MLCKGRSGFQGLTAHTRILGFKILAILNVGSCKNDGNLSEANRTRECQFSKDILTVNTVYLSSLSSEWNRNGTPGLWCMPPPCSQPQMILGTSPGINSTAFCPGSLCSIVMCTTSSRKKLKSRWACYSSLMFGSRPQALDSALNPLT